MTNRVRVEIDGDEVRAIGVAMRLMSGMGYTSDALQLACLIARVGTAMSTQPGTREAFEAAYVAQAEEFGLDLTAEGMRAMRDGEEYGSRGYLNGCWWGWQAREKVGMAQALSEPATNWRQEKQERAQASIENAVRQESAPVKCSQRRDGKPCPYQCIGQADGLCK